MTHFGTVFWPIPTVQVNELDDHDREPSSSSPSTDREACPEGDVDSSIGVGSQPRWTAARGSGHWYLCDDAGVLKTSFFFENPGDSPIYGDWDGDGVETPGSYRRSDGYVYLRNSNTQGPADIKFYFGDPGDRFVAGDWGVVHGRETPGLFRPSNQTFYFRYTLTQGNADAQFTWTGADTDWLPVSGDFNHD